MSDDLGSRAVAKGWLKPEQLKQALHVRKTLGPQAPPLEKLLVEHRLLTEAQVRELIVEVMPARVRCPKCDKVWKVTDPLAAHKRKCKHCAGPLEPVPEEPTPHEKPRTVRRVAKRNRALLLACSAGGSLLAIGALVLVLLLGKKPPSAPPPEPAPVVEKKPEPAKPITLADRIAALAEREKSMPRMYKSRHRLWTEILPEAAGTKHEKGIRLHLEELESAANKEYREAFRPTQELLDPAKPAASKARLQAWKIPEELDIDGSRAAELKKQIEVYDLLIAVQVVRATLEGQPSQDADAMLAPYLKSEHLHVRVEAERALLQVKVTRSLQQLHARMEKRRSSAGARIERVRADIDRDAKAERDRIAAWEKRLQGAKPFSVRSFGVDLDADLPVRSFDGRSIVFANRQMELKYSLDELPADALRTVLTLAVDPGQATDLLLAGKIASRRQMWPIAETFFEKAKAADPRIADRIPDIGKMTRAIASLHGEAVLQGNVLYLDYPFDREDEALDFSATEETEHRVRSGTLAISGRELFYVATKALRLWERVELRCSAAEISPNAAYIVGAAFELAPGQSELLLTLFDPRGAYRVCRIDTKGRLEALSEGSVPWNRSLSMKIVDDQVTVRLGDKVLWAGFTSKEYSSLTPIIGGNAFDDAAATVRYDFLRFEGRASPSAVARLQAERSATIEAELAKEFRTTASEREATEFVSGRGLGDDLLAPLPIERELRSVLPDKVRGLLADARKLLAILPNARSLDEFNEIATRVDEALHQAVSDAPWYPVTYFYLAEWKYVMGDTVGALADLGEAVKRQDTFVEARVARAELLLDLRRHAEADRELEAALAALPDFARARLLRARVRYYGSKPSDAVAELELAMRLEPGDLRLRREAKRLRNIVAGPTWSDMVVVESANYIFRAEVTAKGGAKPVREKAAKYSNYLEVVRAWYPTLLRGKGTRTMKPIVYLFQTAESYAIYGDFTQDDRLEHTAGCFLRKYQQLLFYEDESSQETLDTMAHEAFHEYMESIVPGAPTWISEGMAEYAGAVTIMGGGVQPGRILEGRLASLQAALAEGWRGVPFATLMRETQEEFYTFVPDLQYAQAWSVVHFLIREHKPLLDRYLALLVEGATASKAFEETFAKEDLKAMQARWLDHVRRMR